MNPSPPPSSRAKAPAASTRIDKQKRAVFQLPVCFFSGNMLSYPQTTQEAEAMKEYEIVITFLNGCAGAA